MSLHLRTRTKRQLTALCRLLQAGCSKVFITSRKASACDEAVAALNALPCEGKAISIPADSSKVSEIERLVKEVEKHTDHVDILFANAGATWGSEFEKVDEKNGWDKVMDLNVKGVFFTIQKYAASSLPLSCICLPPLDSHLCCQRRRLSQRPRAS